MESLITNSLPEFGVYNPTNFVSGSKADFNSIIIPDVSLDLGLTTEASASGNSDNGTKYFDLGNLSNGSSSSSSTNANFGSYNLLNAIDYLNNNKFQKHTCAKSIEEALQKAGMGRIHCSENGGDGWAPALHYNGILAKHGWTLVEQGEMNGYGDESKLNLQPGDICIQGNSPTDHKNAHAAFYSGTQWLSDYKQKHMMAYNSHGSVKYFIYRYTGGSSGVSGTPKTNNGGTIYIDTKTKTGTWNGLKFNVAIAGNGTTTNKQSGDNKTPLGTFTLQAPKDYSHHINPFTKKDDGAYGHWFFRFSGKEGQQGIGLHGTADGTDDTISSISTHGCIRVPNKVLELIKSYYDKNGSLNILVAKKGLKLLPRIRKGSYGFGIYKAPTIGNEETENSIDYSSLSFNIPSYLLLDSTKSDNSSTKYFDLSQILNNTNMDIITTNSNQTIDLIINRIVKGGYATSPTYGLHLKQVVEYLPKATGEKKAFAEKRIASYKKAGLDNNTALVYTAQDVLESGWGKHLSGSYNYGGIKAKTGSVKKTHEVRNGKETTEYATFRNFLSEDDYTQYKINLLNKPRYNLA